MFHRLLMPTAGLKAIYSRAPHVGCVCPSVAIRLNKHLSTLVGETGSWLGWLSAPPLLIAADPSSVDWVPGIVGHMTQGPVADARRGSQCYVLVRLAIVPWDILMPIAGH